MSTRRLSHALFGILLAIHLASCGNGGQPFADDMAPSALTPVRFGNLPYADHTYSSIGLARGWFEDVGIDPSAETIRIEEAVPSLSSGAFDVVSVPPGILFSAYDTAQNLCTFVFGDLFQGYAIMAQADGSYRSYEDLISAGLSHDAAVREIVQQLRGRTFAYPTENAIQPFIDLALGQAGLTRDDFESLVLDDPLTVNAMRTGQADFQVGGVPSRITLQKEGFVPILSSVDLARGARPSADSQELASILQNGWAMRKDAYQSDQATALRLASVNYRIMEFMETNRDEALDIHMAYLSRETGQDFTVADGNVIYDDLDPFVTYEDQRPWFYDDSNPLYYAHVNGAILQSFIASDVYSGEPPTVEDIICADDTYRELERLRGASEELFRQITSVQLVPEAEAARLADARRYFEIYDYYDAERIASALWQDLQEGQ